MEKMETIDQLSSVAVGPADQPARPAPAAVDGGGGNVSLMDTDTSGE